MSLFEFLVCSVLVLVAAYMSASEVALFSLSRFQLRSMRESFRPNYRRIKRLLADPGGLLITILVVNEVVNIAVSAMITSTISQQSSSHWIWNALAGTLISAPIVLLACDITPKVIAARANQLIAGLTSRPLGLIYDLFRPVRVALTSVVRLASRWGGDMTYSDPILKESDFLLMVEEGHKSGAIQSGELELIRNVFDLDDTTVADVLTPLHLVQSISAKTSLKSVLGAVRGQRYSRVPVIGTNKREVVGVLYSKDLLRAKLRSQLLEMPAEAIMRKPLFVSPSIRLRVLFRIFKQQKTHMAVVRDANNEAIGVVTMADLLDTLLDDFFPDEEEA